MLKFTRRVYMAESLGVGLAKIDGYSYVPYPSLQT